MRDIAERRRSKWEAPERGWEEPFAELRRLARRYWAVPVTGAAALILLPGLVGLLTGERHGEVSGVATYNGRPIPWGRVTFVGEAGTRQAISGVIKNGAFTVKGCPAGPARVSVESLRAPKSSVRPPPAITKGFTPPAGDAPPPEAAGKHLPIPVEYSNADTSGLRYEVRGGRQTHDISLPARQ